MLADDGTIIIKLFSAHQQGRGTESGPQSEPGRGVRAPERGPGF
jgi:hypothetical protein